MAPETASRSKTMNAEWMETSVVYAHFPLRIALVAVFAYHGAKKFWDLEMFNAMMAPPGGMMGTIALATMEAGIALLVILGMFERFRFSDQATRLAGALTMVAMVGAISQVHWGRWGFEPTPSHPMGGMEFQAVLFMVGLYFVLRGNKI